MPAVLVDYSKAFNRICHNTVITILIRMIVPGWLLMIVYGIPDREGTDCQTWRESVTKKMAARRESSGDEAWIVLISYTDQCC